MGRSRGVCCAVACGMVLLCALTTPGVAGECPELIATFDLGGTYLFRDLSENYAFLTTGLEGPLTILDLASPADPVVVFSGSLPGNLGEAWDFNVSNGIAYYLSSEPWWYCVHLVVVDVHNPIEPVWLGDLVFGTFVFSGCRGFSPRSLVISGDHAYVMGEYSGSDSTWVKEVDISNPSAPAVGRSFEHLFPEMGPESFTVSDGWLFVSRGSTLITSDLSAPILLETGRLELSETIRSLVYSEGYLYLHTLSSLRVIDVSSPSVPVEVGSVEGGFSWCAVANRVVYCSTGNGLVVIDATYPWSPVTVGSWIWQEPDLMVAGAEVSGKWLYTLEENPFVAGWPTYLSVFDTAACRPPYYRYPIAPPQVE